MTWTFSAEEWLVDFTSTPRGEDRAAVALDPLDEQVRALLPWITAAPQLVMPSIVPKKAPAKAAEPPPQPASEPVPPPPTPRVPPPIADALEIELRPPSPKPNPAEGLVFIPNLTRGGSGPHQRASIEPTLEIGIPDDDDLFGDSTPAGGSSIAADLFDDDDEEAAPVEAPAPAPAPVEVEAEAEAEIEVDTEVEVETEVEAEPEVEVEAEVEVETEESREIEIDVAEEAVEEAAEITVEVTEEAEDEVYEEADEVYEEAEEVDEVYEEDEEVEPPPAPVPPTPPSPPPMRAEAPPPPPRAEAPPPPAPPPARPEARPARPEPAAPSKTKKRRAWYDEVFGDHYPYIMPRDADVAAEHDVEFMIKSAKLDADDAVLDVGCGDGRHLFGFSKSGFNDLTGLDVSLSQLINAARRNLASGAGLSFLYGDMRDLPTDSTYDVVTCLGTTFGYFEDEQNRSCLQQMVELLNPGGKIILQVMNRDHMMNIVPCRSWWQGRGCLVLDVAEMSFFSNRLKVHRTIVFEDGRQFEHNILIRTYTVNDLAQLFASMGMRVIEISGSRATPGRFFGAASPDIWVCAQKKTD